MTHRTKTERCRPQTSMDGDNQHGMIFNQCMQSVAACGCRPPGCPPATRPSLGPQGPHSRKGLRRRGPLGSQRTRASRYCRCSRVWGHSTLSRHLRTSPLPVVPGPAARRGKRHSTSVDDVEALIRERGSRLSAANFLWREVWIPDPPVPAPVPLAPVAVVLGRPVHELPGLPHPVG